MLVDYSRQMEDYRQEANWFLKTFVIPDINNEIEEREALFSNKFTHVGVACGCDSTFGDICCVMLGKNINDVQHGKMDPLPVKAFSKKECPKSAQFSRDTVGDKEQYHLTKDVGTEYVMNEKKIGSGTFEKISKGIFEEF